MIWGVFPLFLETPKSGQNSIIPEPELRGFWGSSLIKPPFRVTSAEVVIICPAKCVQAHFCWRKRFALWPSDRTASKLEQEIAYGEVLSGVSTFPSARGLR